MLSRARATQRCLRAVVPPLCSSEPLLSSAMRARWDGGPFACLYTSASSTEAFVPIVLPRRNTPFRKPRCFSPLESNDGRDRSLNHSTGPSRYAAVIPALQRRVSAPFFTEGPCPGLTAPSRGGLRLDGSRRGFLDSPHRSALTASTTRPLAELTYRELREALCQTARSRSTKKSQSNHFFSSPMCPHGCPQVLHRTTARLVLAGFGACAFGMQSISFEMFV